MDAMDISDILREFDAENAPSNSKDYEDLLKWWVNERAAPEILQYQDDLVERIMNRVRRQIEHIEDQTGNLDPRANFQLIIIQTELERVKFLIRSYLRTRIAKIDKHALHILSTPTLRHLLSPSEQTYLKTHQALLNELYLSSFLKNFPENLRRLDDSAGGISMVEEPDLDSAVFLRVVRDVDIEIAWEGGETVPMRAGDVYVIRYSAVKEAVKKGEVELI
ncbi:GINS complex subunit [Orbilia ellipsospora]|uniref:DNA replication complex GINS protein SLD5 n=1 Tax=Orbilia ellipsospora TaxID=2528407 RepID=A0AAV9XQ41_9PEZI